MIIETSPASRLSKVLVQRSAMHYRNQGRRMMSAKMPIDLRNHRCGISQLTSLKGGWQCSSARYPGETNLREAARTTARLHAALKIAATVVARGALSTEGRLRLLTVLR